MPLPGQVAGKIDRAANAEQGVADFGQALSQPAEVVELGADDPVGADGLMARLVGCLKGGGGDRAQLCGGRFQPIGQAVDDFLEQGDEQFQAGGREARFAKARGEACGFSASLVVASMFKRTQRSDLSFGPTQPPPKSQTQTPFTPAAAILGANVGMTFKNGLDVTLWGRNLTNNRDFTQALYISAFGITSSIRREPATYGGTVSFKF